MSVEISSFPIRPWARLLCLQGWLDGGQISSDLCSQLLGTQVSRPFYTTLCKSESFGDMVLSKLCTFGSLLLC